MKTYNHYIDNEWVEPSSGAYLDSENHFTDENWARIARGNAEDADLAVKAAKQAFENSDWAEMRPTQRGKLLVGLAEIIEREAVRLGEIEVRDNGKLIAEMGAFTIFQVTDEVLYKGLVEIYELEELEGVRGSGQRNGPFH